MTSSEGTRAVAVAVEHNELIQFMVSGTRGKQVKRYGEVTAPFGHYKEFYVFCAALGWAVLDGDTPRETGDLRDARGKDGTPNPVTFDLMWGTDGFRLLINTLSLVRSEGDIECFDTVDGRVDDFCDYMYEGMCWLQAHWDDKSGPSNVAYPPAALVHDAIREFGRAGFSYVEKDEEVDQSDFLLSLLEDDD